MTWLQDQLLYRKITRLLRACGDWIRRFGRFGPIRDMPPDGQGSSGTADGGGAFRWVYDPHRRIWLLEVTHSYRSLECRVRAGEAEAPAGVQAMRRILSNRL